MRRRVLSRLARALVEAARHAFDSEGYKGFCPSCGAPSGEPCRRAR